MYDRLAGKREGGRARELAGHTTDKTAHAVEISIHEISLVIVGDSQTHMRKVPEDVACRTTDILSILLCSAWPASRSRISSIFFSILVGKRNQGDRSIE